MKLKHEELFQGQCNNWTGDLVTIHLCDDIKHLHEKPYNIPMNNEDQFKCELDWHCEIG